ncbi:MAG: C25 family cysteine peptidase [candidate division WOR-3 bacterium]
MLLVLVVAGLFELNLVVPDSGVTCRLVPVSGGLRPRVEVASGTDCRFVFGEAVRAAGLELVPLVAEASDGPATLKVEYPTGLEMPERANEMTRFMVGRTSQQEPDGVPGAGYLIVVPDEFYTSIVPLAEWKARKGFKVWVKKTSETGSQRDQIRSYIENAYRTWNPVPSYVLLVGAVSKIPAFITAGTPCVTDHPYACVDGDDYLADLFVGRLPAANVSELEAMVAKTIGYESSPATADPGWFTRALAVGTSYQEGGTPAVTALATKRRIREELLAAGFTQVDTVFYPPQSVGRGPVDSAVNRGVSFINGRGWGNYSGWGYPQFFINDVYNLNNGWKLPVVTSIYCGTGNYAANPCFGEAWLRAGTPQSPKGAVAFWGSSYTGTSTRWNNCMDYGIYRAILDEATTTCGPAMYSGKLALLENFPLPGDSFDLRLYFHVYNLLGDPALEMWTATPGAISVTYPTAYPVGTSSFVVEVRDAGNAPKAGALVGLRSPSVTDARVTDAAGQARFVISGTTAETMFVTVTGRNLLPHLGASVGVNREVFVGIYESAPESVAPGAVAELNATLRNFGTSRTANSVQAVLRALDTTALIVDSVKAYGDLNPGQSGSAVFKLRADAVCTSGTKVPLTLRVTSGDSVWLSALELVVRGPTLKVIAQSVHDGNGVLEPEEEVELSVRVLNAGRGSAEGMSAVLRSANPAAIEVLDSLADFGTLAPGESLENLSDRFRVRAASGIGVGRRFTLTLQMRGTGGWEQSFNFAITVGHVTTTAPYGPDRYGYYAYDDNDAGYLERPTFNWIEIDPAHGGSGTRLALRNDTAVVVDLPFTFRFYGSEFSRFSVSDNGYVVMGASWLGEQYNWRLPSPMGLGGLVAAFWDDFRPDTAGASGVFTYHDAANHRLIVEWSRCAHMHGYRPPYPGELQTFQAIFYDPQHHSTVTGDGPIDIQYLDVSNDDTLPNNNHNYATVGLQSPDQRIGLEYTFGNVYPAAAAPIVPGRAIRFTTNPPDTFTALSETRPETGEAYGVVFMSNPGRGRVRFGVATGGPTRAQVFDAAGRVIRETIMRAGITTWVWDGRDNKGRQAPAGAYRLVLTDRDREGRILSVGRQFVLVR